jgi:hypothetical protein
MKHMLTKYAVMPISSISDDELEHGTASFMWYGTNVCIHCYGVGMHEMWNRACVPKGPQQEQT